MKLVLTVAIVCILAVAIQVSDSLAEPTSGNRLPVSIISNALAPAQGSVELSTPGNFPYKIPVGYRFEITHILLVNKYPYDPPRYGGALNQMYLQIPGMTVTSHHPEVTFNPPLPYSGVSPLRAWIVNAQSEPQWTYVVIQGYLVPK